MNNKTVLIGATVFHKIFYHWGEGKVVGFRDRDSFGYPVRNKWLVEWSGRCNKGQDKKVWCPAVDLRKTYNHKKEALVEGLKLLSQKAQNGEQS